MCGYGNGRVAEQKAEEAAAAKKAEAAAKQKAQEEATAQKKAAKKVEGVPVAKKKAQEAAPTRMRYGAARLADAVRGYRIVSFVAATAIAFGLLCTLPCAASCFILACLCGISVVYNHSF
jgi:Flp pilus assembly protein TadB